jgi:hypothetical protein
VIDTGHDRLPIATISGVSVISTWDIKTNDRDRRPSSVPLIRRTTEPLRPCHFVTGLAKVGNPPVKGLVTMVNSIYNGYRVEDVWLDK